MIRWNRSFSFRFPCLCGCAGSKIMPSGRYEPVRSRYISDMTEKLTSPDRLRIAIGQLNPTVGDVKGNLAKARRRGLRPRVRARTCCC